MNAIAKTLAASAITLLALSSSVLYVRTLRAELIDTRRDLADATRSIAVRDGTIEHLRQDAQNKAKQQAQLDIANGAIAATLASVRQKNRRLIDENALLRAWADGPLPADVIRMSASPALTGADDYRAAMPSAGPVYAAGDGAPH
jgi:LysB family phage lysis regulatory protein